MTDISTAFNMIKSEVLLSKIKYCGFKEWTRKLVQDYLTEKSTRNKDGNYLSGSLTFNSGVGEGSVLGPANLDLTARCLAVNSGLCRSLENLD